MPSPFAPPAPPPRPAFRSGRGLLHAVLALVAVVVIFGILAAVLRVADPERFGEGVGRFAFFVFLGALGVSALAQTGRRTAARVVGGLLGALVVGVAVMAVVVSEQHPEGEARPLPSDELVRAEGTLRHPSLRVSIPDPGPGLQPAPELARQMTATVPGGRAWVYGDTGMGEVVIVLLTSGTAANERDFETFFEGVVQGQLSGMTMSGMKGVERERSVRWQDRRAHLYVVVNDAIHMRIDAFGLAGGETFVLVSAAPTAERFATLADGVRTP